MWQFQLEYWWQLATMLSAEISKHEGDGNAYVAAPGDAEKMRQAQSLLATTGFPMSAKSLGRLATILDSQCTQDEYSKAIREVRNRLEDESEGFFLIHIESTRAFYFDKRFDQLTSPAVSTTLPTISTDFVEASNCYALRRTPRDR